jgi:nucleoside-diphosphate-sugar epimerase
VPPDHAFHVWKRWLGDNGRWRQRLRTDALVTGANGFVARTIARAWRKAEGQVVGLVRSTRLRMGGSRIFRRPLRLIGAGDRRFLSTAVLPMPSSMAWAPRPWRRRSATRPGASTRMSTILCVLEGVRSQRYRPRVIFPSSAAVIGEPEQTASSQKPINSAAVALWPAQGGGGTRARDYAMSFDVPVAILRVFSCSARISADCWSASCSSSSATSRWSRSRARRRDPRLLHEERFRAMTFAVLARADGALRVLNVAAGRARAFGSSRKRWVAS